MKKRTSLVCFLIFTLCVFYTAIPNTVFGQEEGIALAEKVFENPESKETLLDEEVRVLLPLLKGLGELPLPIPNVINIAIGSLDRDPTGEDLKGIAATFGVTLTDDHITLLKREDVQTLLQHEDTVALLSLQGAELDAGLDKILELVDEAVPEEETPPAEEETPPVEEETPPVEEETPPVEEETPPVEEETPPVEEETPPVEEETPPTEEVVPPPPEVPMVEPFEPVPTDLSKLSRLGGLSLNNASVRQFVEDLIAELAPAGLTLEAEVLVDALLDRLPDGYLPKRQIRQILLSKRLSAFPKEADYLDSENFGNAITPDFNDFIYTDFGKEPNRKYLTSDGLHVYMRVPAKVDDVEFSLSGGTTVPGTEVTSDEFRTDTIPYTFRLEETLAATNLPAWPALDTQLFSSVTLWYSTDGLDGPYLTDTMTVGDGKNGVVWEKSLGIPASGSVYYYFEVELAEPLLFTTLDRDAYVDWKTATLDDALAEENIHKIQIDSWVMPDPRNLQLADRGIRKVLFTSDLVDEFRSILTSPQVIDIALRALAGQQVDINEILNAATPEQMRRIQSILNDNANDLITQFEDDRDPLLASVFTVPNVDLEAHSLWTAHIDIPNDGNYQLKADVLDADGTVLARIQENITVDTTAPEGGVNIGLGENVNGYQNGDVFIATAPTAGTAATLNISGMATDIGPGVGYLFYQLIGLMADGTPSTELPNTWMPLTVESTMLASRIWNELVAYATDEEIASVLKGLVNAGVFNLPAGFDISVLDDATIAGLLRTQTLEGLLSTYLTVDSIQGPVDMFLKGLEPFIGFSSLSDSQYQLIVDALGATVDLIDKLVPVTFNLSDHVVMPIQGEEMALMVGDYGIRALGIDTRFNVGAYAAPTRLSVVSFTDPEQVNSASVVLVSIGDRNGDGVVDERYEHGTIYANTTEGVALTIKIGENPHFLESIVLEVQGPGGWQPVPGGALSAADLAGKQVGDEIIVTLDVPKPIFDQLISAGDTVMVRAVATNQLGITDAAPMEFSIKLDAGHYPPEVLDITVDEASITMRNPDSDAPQGTVTINATTLPLTGPRTVGVRFVATQGDGEPIDLGTATQSDTPGLVDAVEAAVEAAAEGTDAPINTDETVWSLTVDTTTLEDTITKDSPGARDVSKDDNKYTIRAFAVSADGIEWPSLSDAMDTLSVDNVDDVEPLGPTHITAIAKDGVAVEADPDGGYTLRGLVDAHDPSVVPQSVTLTIEPAAVRKTYESVMLVSDPEISAELIGASEETAEGSGVFTITVDVGELGIAGNGAYTLHAVSYDASPDGPDPELGNVQVHSDETTERTIHVKNYERPDPAVFKITKDLGTEKNADSEGPQGTFMFTGYTIEQNSPPIMSIRLEAKRASDTEWTTIGTGDASTSVDIEDAALPGVLDHLIGVADEGTTAGNKSVVAIDKTYQQWTVSVDTRALGLEDSIIVGTPGERDYTMDNNPYTVRAFAVDGSGKEWASDATEMFSLDNVDDVAPLGPTHITAIAKDGVMVEADPDGGYTLRGLVDEHDPSVVPQTVTLTIEPDAKRKTYESVMLVSDPAIDAALVGASEETAEGSGVFTITVNVGELGIAGNGAYTLHAVSYDASPDGPDPELGNVQEHSDETTERTIHVKNYERPDPAVFKIAVDVGTEKSIDSGGPQGTFTFTGYAVKQNSPPIASIRLEAKRASDTEWTTIGTSDASTSVDIEDAALPGVLDHLTGVAVDGTEEGNKSVVAIDTTYQQWTISADTVALKLEDTIMKDSDAARDHTQDDNQYTVRAFAVDGSGKEWPSDATAMFSLDNVDDVAPLEPTSISVTSVDGIDTVLETAEDGSFTVGGLVDRYDDAVPSPVATFTIKPVAKRETYKSVKLKMYPEGALVGEITETAEGSGVFTVTVDVGTLADGETYLENGTYTFQALAYDGVMDVVDDEFGNVETPTDGSKASVTVDNSYRPAPEVLVIAVDPESITQTNPDSGAPQGNITLNSRSYEITSPPISGMLYEVKRPSDEAWIDVGTATESMMVSDVSDAELADFVGDVASAAASETAANESGEPTVVPINRSQTYQEWMLDVDTTMIMPDAPDKGDTITKDNPDNLDALRDHTKDNNQYMVRVTAIADVAKEPDPKETMSADGITAHFSVDNVDDVSPVGPTRIIAVADDAGMFEANEDGSYTISNVVDDTLLSPMATFTIQQNPDADPRTYEGGSVNLVQTTADGTETTTEGEAGVLDTITIDVGILENGTYMFHALTVDEFGNVQADMSETDGSKITVHILNFRVSDVTDLAVIAVDGTDVPEPPEEPIQLRESVTVSFMVANGSLAAGELSGAVYGQEMPYASDEDPENTFTLMVEVGSLADGRYEPDGVVTKRDRPVEFRLTDVNVDNTGPVVIIESPTDGDTVDSLPTVHASYHDGEGSGTDKDGQEVLPWATTELADGPTLGITRVQPEQGNTDVEVDQNAIEADNDTLVYTRIEKIPGGAYTITVQVADVLGNVGTGTREFVINGTAPTVAIHSPAPGQTFEHGEPLISGEVSGVGTGVTTFTINDVDATPEVDGNQFSYTPDEALTNGDYKVVVAVTDGNGNMAQTSVTFIVDIPEPPKDTTPPVISSVAPTGLIKGTTQRLREWNLRRIKAEEDKEDFDEPPPSSAAAVVSAVVTDEQSDILAVEFNINGVKVPVSRLQIAAGTIEAPIDFATHGPGLYTVRLKATSEGGTTEHAWSFTFVIDDVAPTISSVTPNGTIRTETPTISVSATDEAGVDRIRISLFNGQNQQVKGEILNDAEGDNEGKAGGITRADFIPENPLTEGTYLIIVDAADTLGNTATARGSFTIDFDTAAPIITMASPHQNARFILKPGDKAPTVSIAYADAESGVDVESVRMVIEGVDADYKATPSGTQITFQPGQKSASQAIHPLAVDTNAKPETWAGEYVVRFEVADKAHLAGYVSKDNEGTREANTTVHTFSFFLEAAEGPILAARPLNYPNPFKDKTRISFSLARQATVSIVIYDVTLRPVRVLVDNRVFDAGNYTLKETGSDAIGWDGTSSSGEDLARGIYFCEIIVADGFEPEYAVLKLALTR